MTIILQKSLFLVDDECYEVKMYHEGIKLKEYTAYVMLNDLVYPYRGKYDPVLSKKPGSYTEKGKHIKIPFPKDMWDKYSAKKIKNTYSILEELKNNSDNFVSDETMEEALSNGEMLRPVIKESDDFLKYLVKQIILIKGVNVAHYKKQFKTSHEFPNLKQALEKDTKMTVTNFKRWAELLNFDYKIMIEDKDGSDLFKDVNYDSKVL